MNLKGSVILALIVISCSPQESKQPASRPGATTATTATTLTAEERQHRSDRIRACSASARL